MKIKMKDVKKALSITGPKTIILDSDDVLMFTNDAVLEIYNFEHGTNFTRDDITEWIMDDGRDYNGIIPRDFLDIFSRESFFQYLTPDPEAQAGVKMLVEAGYDIIICTAGEYTGTPDKGISFEDKFPEINKRNFIFGWRKDVITADYQLDDGLHNLLVSKCRKPFVMDRPWNRVHNHPEARHLYRVNSFLEFVLLVFETTIDESIAMKGEEVCI